MIYLKSKKILLVLLLSSILMIQPLFCSAKAMGNTIQDDTAELDNLVLTLLMPSIREAVNSFYEPYLTIEPTVATYYASKIIEIQGEGSNYTVTVEVFPYVGPHISVGKDRITLNIKQDSVSVENYEHLESHELPQHLQSLLKKPLPQTD